MTLRISIGALLLSATAVTATDALPPLRDNAYINRTLLAGAIGDEIGKNCPTISARIFRALAKAKELERHAQKLGYSDDQIEAFIDSKTEQARLKAQRDAYLTQHGVAKGDADSYCNLGYEEIEKGSLTGKLLRAR